MLIKVRQTITLIKGRGLIEKFYDALDTLLTLGVSLILNYEEVASGVKCQREEYQRFVLY